MNVDLDAPNITAQLKRILGCIDRAPHLFLNVPWCPPPTCGRDRRLASEFKPNPAKLEDHCVNDLRVCSSREVKRQCIRKWLEDETIDIDQAVFIALTHGVDPRALTT